MGSLEIQVFDNELKIHDLGQKTCLIDFIRELTLKQTNEKNSFFVADLDEIYERHQEWKRLFPRIESLYAVKSNYDLNVLKLLVHLGVGFDCSSLGEIRKIIQLGVEPNKIVFANPCKLISEIRNAKEYNVLNLVFDNEYELIKIKENHPKAQCFLRIKVNSLPTKFGADIPTAMKLIDKAIESNIKLNGISFYVGFRQENSINIIESIKNAKILFDYAKESHGLIMDCLDIGGGFPGTHHTKDLVVDMAKHINSILDEYFPPNLYGNQNFKIISELGTYYTSSAYTLCVHIMAKKEILPEPTDNSLVIINGKTNTNDTSVMRKLNLAKSFIYYINDSSHASFKWYTIKEGRPLFMSAILNDLDDSNYFISSIAGATCDSGDFILKNVYMPELEIGEYLIFKNMGSYTKTCAVAFNEIPLPKTVFVSSKFWNLIKDAFQ